MPTHAPIEVRHIKRVQVVAETVGDVARWLQAAEDGELSRKLIEPVTLTVEYDTGKPA